MSDSMGFLGRSRIDADDLIEMGRVSNMAYHALRVGWSYQSDGNDSSSSTWRVEDLIIGEPLRYTVGEDRFSFPIDRYGSPVAYILRNNHQIALVFRGTDKGKGQLISDDVLGYDNALHGDYLRSFPMDRILGGIDKIKKDIAENDNSNPELFITGHSLGGAAATEAFQTYGNSDLAGAELHTFASPLWQGAGSADRAFHFGFKNDVVFGGFTSPLTETPPVGLTDSITYRAHWVENVNTTIFSSSIGGAHSVANHIEALKRLNAYDKAHEITTENPLFFLDDSANGIGHASKALEELESRSPDDINAFAGKTGEYSAGGGNTYGVIPPIEHRSPTLNIAGVRNYIFGDPDHSDAYFGGQSNETYVMSGGGYHYVRMNGGSDRYIGGWSTDIVDGGKGRDTIGGKGGDDYLFGGKGLDHLYGDAGNDVLHGGKGRDVLTGGADNDDLYGGKGVDTYNFHATQGPFGTDTIIEPTGSETIEINLFGWNRTSENFAYRRVVSGDIANEPNAEIGVYDLKIFVGDGGVIYVKDYYKPENNHIVNLNFENGSFIVPKVLSVSYYTDEFGRTVYTDEFGNETVVDWPAPQPEPEPENPHATDRFPDLQEGQQGIAVTKLHATVEGDERVFYLVREGDRTESLRLRYEIDGFGSDPISDSDIRSKTGTVFFEPGENDVAIRLRTVNDILQEDWETGRIRFYMDGHNEAKSNVLFLNADGSISNMRDGGAYTTFEIKDNGKGVDPERLAELKATVPTIGLKGEAADGVLDLDSKTTFNLGNLLDLGDIGRDNFAQRVDVLTSDPTGLTLTRHYLGHDGEMKTANVGISGGINSFPISHFVVSQRYEDDYYTLTFDPSAREENPSNPSVTFHARNSDAHLRSEPVSLHLRQAGVTESDPVHPGLRTGDYSEGNLAPTVEINLDGPLHAMPGATLNITDSVRIFDPEQGVLPSATIHVFGARDLEYKILRQDKATGEILNGDRSRDGSVLHFQYDPRKVNVLLEAPDDYGSNLWARVEVKDRFGLRASERIDMKISHDPDLPPITEHQLAKGEVIPLLDVIDMAGLNPDDYATMRLVSSTPDGSARIVDKAFENEYHLTNLDKTFVSGDTEDLENFAIMGESGEAESFEILTSQLTRRITDWESHGTVTFGAIDGEHADAFVMQEERVHLRDLFEAIRLPTWRVGAYEAVSTKIHASPHILNIDTGRNVGDLSEITAGPTRVRMKLDADTPDEVVQVTVDLYGQLLSDVLVQTPSEIT